MLLPAVACVIIFSYIPMYGVTIAFKNYSMRKGIMGSPWCGLDNFRRLFSSYWFPIIVKNTLTISVLGFVVGFLPPIVLALMLNELSTDWIRKSIQTVSYVPHFISTVVMCGLITLFLAYEGPVNKLTARLFGSEPYNFMANVGAFKWIYVLSGVWEGVGWSSIIFYAALSGVDKELLEAAQIDGASRLQRIWHINVPTLVPTIVILTILSFGSLFGVGYEKTYLLQNSVNLPASEVISTYVYKVGLVQNDFAFSTATGVLNSVINTALLLLANAVARKVSDVALW